MGKKYLIGADNQINMVFEAFYNAGLTDKDIKEASIEALLPFFTSREYIEKNKLYLILMTDILGLITLKQNNDYYNLLGDLIKYYEITNNKIILIENYVKIVEYRKIVISHYYTIFITQKKITEIEEMSLYEGTKIIFDSIGDIIESILKSYFWILYLLENNGNLNLEDIEKIDLGKIVEKLEKNYILKNFLIKKNYNNDLIRISQLRNIWGHKNYEILEDKGIIKCKFGKQNITEIFFKLDDLINISQDLFNLYKSIYLSLLFFLFRNNKDLNKKYGDMDFGEVRDISEFDTLITKLGSQGFKVLSYDFLDNSSYLSLKDLTSNNDIFGRAVHSSYFLYHLFLFKNVEYLEIDYIPYNSEKPLYKFKVNGDVCKKIYNGDKDFFYLTENLELLKL